MCGLLRIRLRLLILQGYHWSPPQPSHLISWFNLLTSNYFIRRSTQFIITAAITTTTTLWSPSRFKILIVRLLQDEILVVRLLQEKCWLWDYCRRRWCLPSSSCPTWPPTSSFTSTSRSVTISISILSKTEAKTKTKINVQVSHYICINTNTTSIYQQTPICINTRWS